MREPVQDTLITTATYSDLRLLSPVNAPLAIDVISFPYKKLCNNMREQVTELFITATHSDCRLPSPVKAPLGIEVK